MKPLQPPDTFHLQAAQGWMELDDHEEANEELELIDAPLRAHPGVLEVRWLIYQKIENWKICKDIGTALMKLAPERTTGWIHRCSFALHEMKRTQEAYDALKPALGVFKKEYLVWCNMAYYACVLGNKEEARELLDKAIVS